MERMMILSDPQTSGGLLITVEKTHTQEILDMLTRSGHRASNIGDLSTNSGQVSISLI
jgi:selenophosphate synthase